MWIWNALTIHLCRLCWPEERRRRRLSQNAPSLSATFAAFQDSWAALRLCAFYFVSYILLAIVAYSFILEPDWTIIEAIYFSIVTFTTVGFGDLVPTTDAGRLFTIFFALYGIVILGIFLGIIGHVVGELQSQTVQQIEQESSEHLMSMLFTTSSESNESAATGLLDVDTGGSKHASESQPQASNKEQKEQQAQQRKPQLEICRKTLFQEVKEVLRLECPILIVVLISALLMGYTKGWTTIQSVYFCVISFTTIGYGDIHADTTLGRISTVFLLPLAVAVFGEILSRIAGVYMRRKNQEVEDKFLHRSLTLCDLVAMDTNQDQLVSREEFLIFMLVTLQKTDREAIDQIMTVFDRLDVDKSGMISKHDLMETQRRRETWKGKFDESMRSLV